MLDFQLVTKVLQLSHLTNQVKLNSNMRSPDLDLEASLLSFAKVFKINVMENRILMLCTQI